MRRPSGAGDFSARGPAVYRSTEAGKEWAEACDGGLVAASEEGERIVAGADTAAGANGVAAQRARAFQEGLARNGRGHSQNLRDRRNDAGVIAGRG